MIVPADGGLSRPSPPCGVTFRNEVERLAGRNQGEWRDD
jgi:hypothetical protein